jgi:hypothetical protein
MILVRHLSSSWHWAGILSGVFIITGCAGSGPAREPEEEPAVSQTVRTAIPPEAEGATIAIIGSVTADSVRFLTDPAVRISFTGNATDTLRRTIRENIPEDVQPGQTYTNVRVYFTLVSRLDSLINILQLEGMLRPDSLRRDTPLQP